MFETEGFCRRNLVIDSGKWVVEKPLLHILGDPIVLLFACFVFSTPEEGYYLFLDKAFVVTVTEAFHITMCTKNPPRTTITGPLTATASSFYATENK